jgi:hypothetical protein
MERRKKTFGMYAGEATLAKFSYKLDIPRYKQFVFYKLTYVYF